MYSMLAHIRKERFLSEHIVFYYLPVTACVVQVIPRFKMSTGQTSLKAKLETVMQPAEPVQIQLTERK